MSRNQTPPPDACRPLPMNTPGRVGTASRSSAQAPRQRAADLKTDIEIDIKKTEKADFDSFLRLFISRCLCGDYKSNFEVLQRDIEGLQVERFDHTSLRKTPKGQGNNSVPEVTPAGTRELDLVERRDKLLNGVLDQCLLDVLDVANNDNIRTGLTKFAGLIQAGSAEKVRYKPYADMHNTALRELAKLSPSSLRLPKFPLCLSRADPKPIIASFFDSEEVTERKPDLVCTSVSAACATHKKSDEGETNGKDDEANEEHIGGEPTTAFTWSQVLSSVQMKTFCVKLSDPAKNIIDEQQQFTGPGIEPHVQYTFVAPETLETIQDQLESGENRLRSQADDGDPSKMRVHTSTTGAGTPGGTNSEKNIDARVQLASYAMEMLSCGPGVAYVINILIIDEFLFLWHYDSQGSIRSDGISIIADFPRFLVLLLAFQRFTIEDWGIVPCLNPQALCSLGIKADADVDVVKLSLDGNHFSGIPHVSPVVEGPLDIELKKYLSAQSHRLSGRMTTVLSATAVVKNSNERVFLACKISRPEVQRISEGDVLRTAQAIALDRAPEMCDHLPELYFSGDFRAGNTLRPRTILRVDGKGHRTLRAVVVNKLEPLTTVTGNSFVKAWLDVVICHTFLWKHGIDHGDPSLSNMMYNPIKQCGVLADFDLTIMAWLKRIPGNDRTGTIPFMALDLLTHAYWDGYRERRHYHELEAFIWILPIVFLAYVNGRRDVQNKFTKDWFTSNYIACGNSKSHFLQWDSLDAESSSDITPYNRLTFDACRMLKRQLFIRSEDRQETLLSLQRDGSKNKKEQAEWMQDDTPEAKIMFAEAMWVQFISVLSAFNSNIQPDDIKIDRLRTHKPTFDIAQCEPLFADMYIIYKRVINNAGRT